MQKIQRVLEPPVEGASRVYRLVPATADDPAEWLAGRLADRGFDLVGIVEFDTEDSATWIAVDGWAIPPNYAELQALKADKARRKAVVG